MYFPQKFNKLMYNTVCGLDVTFDYKMGGVWFVMSKIFTRTNGIKETYLYNLKTPFTRKFYYEI